MKTRKFSPKNKKKISKIKPFKKELLANQIQKNKGIFQERSNFFQKTILIVKIILFFLIINKISSNEISMTTISFTAQTNQAYLGAYFNECPNELYVSGTAKDLVLIVEEYLYLEIRKHLN